MYSFHINLITNLRLREFSITTYITEEFELRTLAVELKVLPEVPLAVCQQSTLGALEGTHGLRATQGGHVASLDVHFQVRVLVGTHIVTQWALNLFLLHTVKQI